jgi:hypothetical protein
MANNYTLLSTGPQHLIKAVTADSVLTVQATSAHDVYVGASTEKQTLNLSAGDSMFVPQGNVSIYLFRRAPDNQAYSATVQIAAAPPVPKT